MNNLNFQTSQEYKKWWDANHTKLQHYSIYSKGAAIWNAAHPLAAPAVANAENGDALPPLPDLPLLGDMGYSSNSSVNAGKSRQHYSAHQIREYAEAYARAAILAHAAPNAQLVDALRDLLANSGYTTMSDDDLREEAGLGNGNAPILLKARAALASLPPQKEAL